MRIKELRQRKKISQKKLAEIVGTNQSAISQWELGLTSPTADKLPLIAHVLECKIDDIYEEKDFQFDLQKKI
ncbi:MAG: helix-turn-helix domain-containing protein [Eubacteriaceae bacterium]